MQSEQDTFMPSRLWLGISFRSLLMAILTRSAVNTEFLCDEIQLSE